MAQATDAVWLSVLPDMSGFGKSMIKGIGKDADKTSKTMGQRIGRGINIGIAAIGVGAAAVGTALYNIGSTFAEVENTIRVGTGATGDALAGLVDSAKNVGNNVPAEFEAIGTVVADVNTRMGLSGETLETVASQYLEAGRILGEEVDIAKTSAAFNAFQIEGEDVSGALDHLFQVSQATGIGMNDLAGAVQSNAPAVQALGFSFEETASLVGNLDKAGLNSSRMMMGMSQSLVRLAEDGEAPADAFRRTVSEIEGFLDAGDQAAAIDLAGEVFGTRNATQFIGAIESGTLAMDDLASVAGMTEDTILGAGEETMEFGEKWQLFKNRIINKIEPAATALFDAIGDGMEWVTNTLLPQFLGGWSGDGGPGGIFQDIGEKARAAFEWIKDNKDILLGVVGALVAAKAAMVAYNAVMAVTRGIKATITALTKGWTVAQRVLNTVMRANPIGLVVTALMLLVGAFKLAWDNSETFRNIVTGAWEGIKAAAAAVWEWMKSAFQWIKDGLSSVGQWFTDRGRDIQNAWSAVKDGLKAGWDFIKKWIFGPIVAYYTTIWNAAVAAKDFIVSAWDSVKNALKAGWDHIKKWTFDAFVNGVRVVWDFFSNRVSDIRGAWDGLKGAFKAVWNWIDRNVFQNFMAGIDTVVGWVTDGVGLIGDLWDGLKDLFMAPINWVIREVWNGGIVRVFNAVADVIPGVGPMREQPVIRARAKGGYTPPGWTLVGEEGPELVNFTRPNRVYTADETRAMLAGQAANPVQAQFSAPNPPHGGVGGWFSDRWDNIKSGAQWVADGVRDAAGNVVKWARGGLAKAAGIVLDPIKSLIGSTLGSSGRFGEMAGGMATNAIDRVLDWVGGHDEGAAPDAGGRSLRGAQPHVNNAAFALADSVGGIRTMQAFNQSMAGGHPRGLAVDFIDTVSKLNRLADVISGGGHFDDFNYMAWQARLWSPGAGWRPQGQGYGNDPMHRWHLHAEWYDQGGMLKPGMGMYANATGRPEPVLTGKQWDDMSTLAARGAAAGLPGQVVLVDRDGTFIARMQTEALSAVGADGVSSRRLGRQSSGRA